MIYLIFAVALFEPICLQTHSTISSLVFYSQIPSQPIIMKSVAGSNSYSQQSGSEVIGYSSGVNPCFYLYFISPKARVKFRFPSTRPSTTSLPAFVILASSIGPSGLWSKLMGIHFPLTPMTHLESPAFATKTFLRFQSITTTFAVQPIESKLRGSSPFSVISSLGFFIVSYKIFIKGDLAGGLDFFIFSRNFWPSSLVIATSTSRKLRLSPSLISSCPVNKAYSLRI